MFAALYPFFPLNEYLSIVYQVVFVIFSFYLFFCLGAIKYVFIIRNTSLNHVDFGNRASQKCH